MSHRAAQRALVRMLFDPSFAAAARHDPETVLAEVPRFLRGQLCAIDPRAFQLDRLRHPRTLAILVEEFPRSAALLAHVDLSAFFSSTAFHQAIAEDRSLPLAFAAYLAELAPTSPVLVEETAIACARRDQSVAPPQGHYALASGVVPIPTASAPYRLAVRLEGDVSVVEISLSLHRLILCLDRPRTHATLLAEAVARGVAPSDAADALRELIDGEIVVRG